jgi:hypothetical protein
LFESVGVVAHIFYSETAYSSSKWISWTSLMCKTSQSALGSVSLTAVSYGVAVDVRVANLPLPTLDVILKISTSNLPATGSFTLQFTGAHFQNSDGSPISHISFTSLETTYWLSHSSVVALSSSAVGKSDLTLLSVAHKRSNSLSLSFVRMLVNGYALRTGPTSPNKFPPTTGAVKLLLSGKGMGVFGISPSARTLLTACNDSPWTSESVIACKVAAGSGSSITLAISLKSMAHIFSQSSKTGLAYALPNIKDFSSGSDPLNIVLNGSNFASFNSDVNSFAEYKEIDGALPQQMGSQQTQILVASDALLLGKSVKDIEVRIQIASTRLDDIVLTLETSPFVGRIYLLKNHCFGCVFTGSNTYVSIVFSDKALRYPPVTDCSSVVYIPSTPFSTMFAYSGLLFLQVTFGSTHVRILSASISIVQSNVNIMAGQIYPSLQIKWFSDSLLEFKIPAILGRNHTFEAIVNGQRSNLVSGLSYPRPIIRPESAIQSMPPSGSIITNVYGSFFGQTSNSLNIRMGKSSCSNSLWISDYQVVCKSSQGISLSNLWGTTATIVRQMSVVKTLISDNESPSLFFATAVNSFSSTGNHLVLMHGKNLGVSRFSPTTRISKSSSASTAWFSDSSVISFAAKWKENVETVVTIAMRSAQKEFSLFLEQNAEVLKGNTSIPKSGCYNLVIFGSGFASRLVSSRARMGESGASATFWSSDSSIAIKNARIGLSGHFGVTVTVPTWLLPIASSENVLTRAPSTELYGTFAFQNRSFVSPAPFWQGYSVLTVQGQNFGFSQPDKFNALSIDPNVGCDSVHWISDTSLSTVCHVYPPGSEVLFRLSALRPLPDVQVMIKNWLKSLCI